MTPKSFFMIVVRILGLYLLIQTLIVIPSIFPMLTMYDDTGIASILFVLAMALVLFLIVYFLFLKPEILIKTLNLDSGFEEEMFGLNFSQSSILKTAIILIGGITLFWEIPNFIYDIFYFWQEKSIKWQEHPDTKNLIYSATLIVISYLLISYNGKIVEYIEKQSKEKE